MLIIIFFKKIYNSNVYFKAIGTENGSSNTIFSKRFCFREWRNLERLFYYWYIFTIFNLFYSLLMKKKKSSQFLNKNGPIFFTKSPHIFFAAHLFMHPLVFSCSPPSVFTLLRRRCIFVAAPGHIKKRVKSYCCYVRRLQ